MGYMLKDHEKIGSLKATLREHGYSLYCCNPGYVIQNRSHRGVALDLFVMNKHHESNQYQYGAPLYDMQPSYLASKLWPREFLYEKEIMKLEKAKICDLNILVPSNTKNVLKRWYGDTVMTEVGGVSSTKAHALRKLQFLNPILEKTVPKPIGMMIANTLFT